LADASPAQALDQVKRIVELCHFIEHPDVQNTIMTKMVPVSMPPDVNALVKISVWGGLGIVGLWAALDAFAERAGLKMPKCSTCGSKICISARFDPYAQGKEGEYLKELEDLRHLYAHNYAGDADEEYFRRPRHVLRSPVPKQLSCGAQFDGRKALIELAHLRRYASTVQNVLERFS
jgi:hypothetical protein